MLVKDVSGSPVIIPSQEISATSSSESPPIRDRILEIVRRSMPIDSLFRPELKIDLNIFIKDQEFISRIALFLSPLLDKDMIETEEIKGIFEHSDLIQEIQKIFKGNLTHFYDICRDVLNQTRHPSLLQAAIEGRIFTLKNALLGIENPNLIQNSQIKQGLDPQPLENIQEEGRSFIREVLNLYLRSSRYSLPFQEELKATAELLIPFVEKVTKSYLRERGKSIPGSISSFRNPTGYNYHGLVAPTIMEVCLNALGYRTKVLHRADLDPRVTLATAHSIVMVLSPDGKRYLVDPCYIQFHKDACLDDRLAPTSPLLVLEENEVDSYIESTIMPKWEMAEELLKTDSSGIIRRQLDDGDRLLSHIIQEETTLAIREMKPLELRPWVKDAFRRVWEISSYSLVHANHGLEEIFFGSRELHATYDGISNMNIASLTSHLSSTEIKRRLASCRSSNTSDVVSLLSKLPSRVERNNYQSLLNCDPRLHIGGIGTDVSLDNYLRSLRQLVNPSGKNLSVIYGCAGADCLSVFLATDAMNVTFVDITKVDTSLLFRAKELLTSGLRSDQMEMQERLNKISYLSLRSKAGGSISWLDSNGLHIMPELEFKFIFDLFVIGVELEDLTIREFEDGRVEVTFPWEYHGANKSRMRRVTFISADITKPEEYPAPLRAKVEAKFDIFYMKSAFFAPRSYPQFLPYLAASIKENGWLMTADKTITMETIHPEPILEAHGLTFVSQTNETIQNAEVLIPVYFDPLEPVPTLDRLPNPAQRSQRNPGSDPSYWTILNLRQKL